MQFQASSYYSLECACFLSSIPYYGKCLKYSPIDARTLSFRMIRNTNSDMRLKAFAKIKHCWGGERSKHAHINIWLTFNAKALLIFIQIFPWHHHLVAFCTANHTIYSSFLNITTQNNFSILFFVYFWTNWCMRIYGATLSLFMANLVSINLTGNYR